MTRVRVLLPGLAWLSATVLLSGCLDKTQAPSPSSSRDARGAESSLGPIDLIYVCGNKFLATNSTRSAVNVTYRVAGTSERGNLTLREASTEDEGSSETEVETVERGVVELYLDDEQVARRRNQGLPCGASPASIAHAVTADASPGAWSAPFAWPNVAVHLNLLPDGKVLSWGLSGTPHVWDPELATFTSVPAPAVIFCAGHSFLEDGRLLVTGGNNHPTEVLNGIPDITIFSAASQSWSRSTPMRLGRWYPTNTTLANGDVVIISGKDATGAVVRQPEVWSSGGALRVLSTAGLSLALYPRTFLAPNGKVFLAGEAPGTRYLDPSGTGSWTSVATRRYGQRDYGAAVMYDDGKILYAGGGRTTNTAEIIDLNSTAPAWQWTGAMAFPRRHLNATVLPTGEVLVTGGSSGIAFNDVTKPVHAAELWNPATGLWTTLASNSISRVYHSTSILLTDGRVLHTGSGDAGPNQRNAELFSPPYLFNGPRPVITAVPEAVGYGTTFAVTTAEAADIATVSLIRLGSATHAFDMNQRFQRLSFTRGDGALTVSAPGSRNRTPPGHYMLFILNGSGVPSVARIVRIGGSAEPPPPPPPPPSFPISLSATGRSDGTAQYMTLKWSGATSPTVDIYRNGARLRTTANDGSDSNGRTFQGDATYVFRVCHAGTTICSNDATVTFGNAPPPNVAPVANFTSSCTDLTCVFADGSTDSDGTVTAWSWTFGDGSTSTARNPSRAYASAGTYTVTLRATDNLGATSEWSSSVTVAPAPSSSITLSATGRVEGTAQYMSLKWTGAVGTIVDIYRNGPRLRTTANDGSDTNGRTFQGAATYVFKVCEAGTMTCSNEATVVFN